MKSYERLDSLKLGKSYRMERIVFKDVRKFLFKKNVRTIEPICIIQIVSENCVLVYDLHGMLKATIVRETDGIDAILPGETWYSKGPGPEAFVKSFGEDLFKTDYFTPLD